MGGILGSLLLALPGVVYCDEDEIDGPFSIANESPFVAVYGLTRHRGASVLDARSSESRIGFNVISNYERDINESGDTIILDGETEIWDLTYLRGLGAGWEAGINVPVLKHSGGYLDRVIVTWHDWFGMPQGGRLSLAYLGDNDVGLKNQTVIAAISSHLAYRVRPRLALKLQWDLNTRAYKDIELEPLNQIGGVLSFGGTIKLTNRDRLDLIFLENVPNGEAAPDFGFKMELSRRIQP